MLLACLTALFLLSKGGHTMTYRHLTYADRVAMETLLNRKCSKADVARYLKVSRATITREYKKGIYIHTNSDLTETEKYSADLAQKNTDYAQTSKGRPLKIGNDMEYAEYLESKIVNDGCSPAVAIALAHGLGMKTHVSVNTLYRYIDHGLFLKLTNKYLPVKSKRKNHKHKIRVQKRMSAGQSIENRSDEVDSRDTFGHWEMDTVKGKKGITKSCLLVLTERLTRREIIRKIPDQGARSVVAELDKLERRLGNMFSRLFKTITVDNGVEFSDYENMKRSLLHDGDRTEIFYCHAYSSYERGSNENANKLIRRHIPKGHDIDKYDDTYVQYIQDWMNSYPRKIHGWRTANDLFDEEINKLYAM